MYLKFQLRNFKQEREITEKEEIKKKKTFKRTVAKPAEKVAQIIGTTYCAAYDKMKSRRKR